MKKYQITPVVKIIRNSGKDNKEKSANSKNTRIKTKSWKSFIHFVIYTMIKYKMNIGNINYGNILSFKWEKSKWAKVQFDVNFIVS